MWRTKLFPELLLLDTAAERKRLLRDAQRKMKHSGWYTVATIVGIIVAIQAGKYVERRVGVYLPFVWTQIVGTLGAALVVAAVFLTIQRLWYKPVRDQLRRQLIARGIPVCLHCGYSLTANVSGRCPECGTGFGGGR